MQTQKKNYVYPMTTVVAAFAATLMANSGPSNKIAANVYDTESQGDDNKILGFGTANKNSGLTLESKGNGNAWDTWDE